MSTEKHTSAADDAAATGDHAVGVPAAVVGVPTAAPGVTTATPGAPTAAPGAPFNIGRETRRWRRSRGLTLAQVGERCGLNIGYLSQIENEKSIPSLEALAAIATALDIPPAWLLLDATTPPSSARPTARALMGLVGR